MFRKGEYVTLKHSKYYPPVYKVIKPVGDDMLVCEYVGDSVNGRLENFPRTRQESYRKIEDLKAYQ